MNKHVVFDTNAYRDIVHNLSYEKSCELINTMKDAETKMGLHPNMCLSVLRELIANFNGYEKLKRECANAASVQYWHCKDEKVEQLRVLPLPEDQIAHCFYDVQDPDFISHQTQLMDIIEDLVKKDTDKTIEKYAEEINSISDFVRRVENEYSQCVISFINDCVGENHKKEKPFCGHDEELGKYKEYLKDVESIFLDIAHTRLTEIENRLIDDHVKAHPSSKEEFEGYKKLYVRHFRPALMMEYQMLTLLPNGYNPELPKHKNLVWDEQIMMILGNTSQDKPFILVTHDKDMFTAAQTQTKNVEIVNLLEYFDMINVECPNEIKINY